MTTPPVGEAAERLRAALADVEAGRKAKLFPADVRALLDFYDQRGETTEPAVSAEPDQVAALADQPEPANSGKPRLSEAKHSLEGIRDALDKMQRPGFDPRLLGVLIPFARAILGQLNREIDEIESGER